MTNTAEQKFEFWCIVELFGHQKIAGKCTEQNVAGNNMLRVDVPETQKQPAFTRFLNHAAIYAINPVTEEVAISYAERLEVMPIEAYNAREAIKKWDAIAVERQIAEGSQETEEESPDFDDYEEPA